MLVSILTTLLKKNQQKIENFSTRFFKHSSNEGCFFQKYMVLQKKFISTIRTKLWQPCHKTSPNIRRYFTRIRKKKLNNERFQKKDALYRFQGTSKMQLQKLCHKFCNCSASVRLYFNPTIGLSKKIFWPIVHQDAKVSPESLQL